MDDPCRPGRCWASPGAAGDLEGTPVTIELPTTVTLPPAPPIPGRAPSAAPHRGLGARPIEAAVPLRRASSSRRRWPSSSGASAHTSSTWARSPKGLCTSSSAGRTSPGSSAGSRECDIWPRAMSSGARGWLASPEGELRRGRRALGNCPTPDARRRGDRRAALPRQSGDPGRAYLMRNLASDRLREVG